MLPAEILKFHVLATSCPTNKGQGVAKWGIHSYTIGIAKTWYQHTVGPPWDFIWPSVSLTSMAVPPCVALLIGLHNHGRSCYNLWPLWMMPIRVTNYVPGSFNRDMTTYPSTIIKQLRQTLTQCSANVSEQTTLTQGEVTSITHSEWWYTRICQTRLWNYNNYKRQLGRRGLRSTRIALK